MTNAVKIVYQQEEEMFEVQLVGEACTLITLCTFEEARQFCKDHNFVILDNAVTFAAQLGELLVRWSESLTDEEKAQVLPALQATTDGTWSDNVSGLMGVLRQFKESN